MFLLFGGDNYYAGGGINDLLNTSEDIDELVEYAKNRMVDSPPLYAIDWWHIVDADKPCEILAGTVVQAYGANDLDGDGEFYGC